MTGLETLSLIVTIVCLVAFSGVFTILFRNYFQNAQEGVVEGKEDLVLLQECALREEEKRSPRRKAIRILKGSLWGILGAAALLFFGFSLAARVTGSPLVLGDYGTLVISSGSMSEKNPVNRYLVENALDDQLGTYDLIGVERISSPEDIALYDIVAFRAEDGRTIVHRVVEIERFEEGTFFLTKGDANDEDDSNALYGDYLAFEGILGRYSGFRIPLLGVFVIFLQSGAGIATILSLIYCYLMYGYFRNRLGKAVDERTEYLLSVIPFAPEEDGEPAYLEEREAILYKGEVYLFREGKLEGSHPASEEETRIFLDGVEEEEEGKPSFLERLRALVPWKKDSSGDEHKDEGSE